MIRDTFRFFYFNLRHYLPVLLGFRLRLDPDYPVVLHFLPKLISDSVFEWRAYGLFALWAFFVAWVIPLSWGWWLVALWAILAFRRARYFQSALLYWQRAFAECPGKARVRTHYAEELMKEIERRMKGGQNWDECRNLIEEAERIIAGTVQQYGRKNNAAI